MAFNHINARATVAVMAVFALVSLSACGGDDGGDGGGTRSYSYDLLRGEEAQGALGGTARYRELMPDGTTGTANVSELAGGLTRDSGFPRISLEGGGSEGGFEQDGDFTSANNRFVERVEADRSTTYLVLPGGFTARRYEYVTPYTTEYRPGELLPNNPQEHDFRGVVGFITNSGNVPGSGIAIYEGDAFGEVTEKVFDTENSETRIQSYQLRNGVSMIEVDFSRGEVDVNMSGFFIVPDAGGPPNNNLVRGIRVLDMEIDGNRFSGGSVTIDHSFNGAVGPRNVGSQGVFFGPNAVEIGGSVLTDDGGRDIDAGVDVTFVARRE